MSHTEISRKMGELNISGTPQGKGLPTLLSPDEQDKIAQVLFQSEPVQPIAVEVEIVGSGLSVYQPKPLARKGCDGALNRQIQSNQVGQALQVLQENGYQLADLIIAASAEQGATLAHQANVARANALMAGLAAGQDQLGKALGVLETPVDG